MHFYMDNYYGTTLLHSLHGPEQVLVPIKSCRKYIMFIMASG